MKCEDDKEIGLLMEAIWNGPPLMSTSVQDLPDHKPYGFWIDRHGNFAIVAEPWGHERIASKIIEQDKKLKSILLKEKTQYRTLWAAGWIRVVLGGDTFYWDHNNKNFTMSHAQESLMGFIKDLYNLSRSYRESVG